MYRSRHVVGDQITDKYKYATVYWMQNTSTRSEVLENRTGVGGTGVALARCSPLLSAGGLSMYTHMVRTYVWMDEVGTLPEPD